MMHNVGELLPVGGGSKTVVGIRFQRRCFEIVITVSEALILRLCAFEK